MKTEEEIRLRREALQNEFQANGHALTQPQTPLSHEGIREKRIKLYERLTELHWVLGEEKPAWESK
ncbi:MAG: hypothetical protein H0T60_19155 [Acidobacteria bacterium]|nr:hypothetical protein [Acidobacteriota bacterium]